VSLPVTKELLDLETRVDQFGPQQMFNQHVGWILYLLYVLEDIMGAQLEIGMWNHLEWERWKYNLRKPSFEWDGKSSLEVIDPFGVRFTCDIYQAVR